MLNLDKINSQFDLNNLDLRNFDIKQIKNMLVQHRKVISVVLLIGSLLWAVMMFMDYRSKAQALHSQIQREQAKFQAIESYNTATKDLNGFISSAPNEYDEFSLATQISKDADLYHISIPTFSPAQSKDAGIYDVRDTSFSAVADNFRDAMLFLRAIEQSSPPLRVSNWSGHEDQNGTVSFDIDINAVHIHS
ncbi:MAG: hypothetical protein KGJ09_04950 [Candidatus Omnitrophica bacterium]|nr:hypothetical protein [Candidatus Omnitrophota bacterium]MDE2009411.1 hypothetical protein [Candidatus Omnitrophota bacterium]MDE2214195.1 hypothetical protein [Candidatus Omnitrophota bacterium]MDE2231232.1 hypothetical protein [Candidatus Omnitrophota bacterium]